MTQSQPSIRDLANAVRALSIDAIDAAKIRTPRNAPRGRRHRDGTVHPDPQIRRRRAELARSRPGSCYRPAMPRPCFTPSPHLAGNPGMSLEQVKNFRQFNSLTPGHPEYDVETGVEMTTGPLGQGLGSAIGMALAERVLNARYGDDLVNHYTWVLAGDGDLMEGLSHEAISLAGALGLSHLIVLYDDNHISIDGPTDIACVDDASARFRACGWNTLDVDGHDADALEAAMIEAKNRRQADHDPLPHPHRVRFARSRRQGERPRRRPGRGRNRPHQARPLVGPTVLSKFPRTSARRGPPPDPEAARNGRPGNAGSPTPVPTSERLFSAPAPARCPPDLNETIIEIKKSASEERPVGPTRQMSGRALEALAPKVRHLPRRIRRPDPRQQHLDSRQQVDHQG